MCMYLLLNKASVLFYIHVYVSLIE